MLPAFLGVEPALVHVSVRDGMVTVTGEVERKSVIALVLPLVRAVDGVVDAKADLTYTVDDSAGSPPRPALHPGPSAPSRAAGPARLRHRMTVDDGCLRCHQRNGPRARAGRSREERSCRDDVISPLIAHARSQTIGDLLRRSAARDPGTIALVYRGLRQTYAELDATVDRTASSLAARGIGPGQRVAIFSHNNHAFVVAYFALARLGAVSVPLNFMLTSAEAGYVLGHSGATGLIAEDALVPVAEQALAAEAGAERGEVTVRGVILERGGDAPPGWESVASWMADGDATPPEVTVAGDDLAQLIYTSGTESRPKGAMLSHRSLIAQYVSCVVDGEMAGTDVEVHSLPLYHCAQLHCFLTPGIYLGATNVVLPGADPAAILAAIEAEHATKLFCPPTVWISLLRHPDFGRRDLSSLRKGYYGASIMPVEVLKEIGARLPDVRLFNFYGQTEMGPLATVLKPADQVRKAGSAGRAALNVETMVVDEAGAPQPAGQIGEIVHRSPHAMLGYWRDPDRTAQAFAAAGSTAATSACWIPRAT